MSEVQRRSLQRPVDLAVEANDIGIKFAVGFDRQRKIRKSLIGLGQARRQDEFWALRGVSFLLRRGELLGVIGKNGSGKTTLLRVLAGILYPDRGSVRLQGHVGTMLQLGAGFRPDLNGRDNILLNGLVLGLSRQQIENKECDIIDFAGLNSFIDSPLKTYSSGMKARLGFSVAASIEADILLVDEILAVGDEAFRAKSYARMMEIYSSGRTVIFASHSLDKLAEICSRIIWLDRGQICFDGEPREAIGRYREFVRK